eukprot:scaffold14049_cov190-Isochrysis_galbana.AAC.2
MSGLSEAANLKATSLERDVDMSASSVPPLSRKSSMRIMFRMPRQRFIYGNQSRFGRRIMKPNRINCGQSHVCRFGRGGLMLV